MIGGLEAERKPRGANAEFGRQARKNKPDVGQATPPVPYW